MFGARKICSFTVNLNQNLKHHLNQKATLLCQSNIFQQKMSYVNNGLNADKLDISGMRKPYRGKHDIFDVSDLVSREPFEQFKSWFEEAKNTEGIMEANAMSLATSTKDGKPSVRMVLMKGIDEKGIVFYTNYLSQKAVELDENNAAALLFYWCSHSERCTVSRQVRIEGLVEKVTQEEATDYFHSRPRDSQIGACVSQQSQVIPNRKIIEERNLELQMKYSDSNTPIPKPDYWGGYRVIPNRFEFWQGQTNRLHDRIVFRRPLDGEQLNPDVTHAGVDGWVYERLMP
ncbi:pyridoxine/pyridoxamine 5'-phosphate oxidase-like isoform X2 [Physella acuta]|uniref:pyridoxine/pyridoxamine 5'-phosphate oxidase-like isoform X2 n=1 Tax=Physella acuta TaxID=109671 RepID=UPI0027DD7A97|nr:pyridoxine/pyridoxamine 5'-phosphate oxidase-like isoform X2 [Physella acuta]